MWQNTGFMLGIAWKNDKSVIFLCIALAMATAGVTIAVISYSTNAVYYAG